MLRKIVIFALFFMFLAQFALADDLDLKISQMIIVGFSGNSPNSFGFKRILKKVKNGEISGVILFDRNIKSYENLSKMISLLKENSKIPLFIAIDNEGGIIQRYRFKQYSTAKKTAQNGLEFAKNQYSEMAKFDSTLGINLNFAPVVDVEINKNSIVAKKERSFSEDKDVVIEYSKIFINEQDKYNIVTSLKHFPGHGSPMGDTHLGFVDITNTFDEVELSPYYELKNIAPSVMVSHLFNSNFDDKYPASLSKKTVDELLRKKIGFDKVVFSDDFDMKAIRDNYSLEDIITLSINSGVDILIFSNNLTYKDFNISSKIHKIVKKQIKNGKIKPETIDESYKRIMALKNSYLK
ncbi:hypothetical protein IJ670_08570 [bacterium]|nr:hypothetical protein [bacterium]